MRKALIVIPIDHTWDWTADHYKQTATYLSRIGYLVYLYEHSIKEYALKHILTDRSHWITKRDGIFFIKRIELIPFRRFKFVDRLNKAINHYVVFLFLRIRYLNLPTYLWIINPLFANVLLPFKKVFGSRGVSLYDCMDYFSSSDRTLEKRFRVGEKYLLTQADLVTVSSSTLYAIHRAIRKDIRLVEQGFDNKVFQRTLKKTIPSSLKIKTNKKKIIGYVGGINDRLDFKLLLPLIKRHKEWNFVFWGPIQRKQQSEKQGLKAVLEEMFALDNVIHNKSTRKEIPYIIRQFDVCMIPYDLSMPLNQNCYPMKLLEYYYEGKPVISTSIQELKNRQHTHLVTLADTLDEWEKGIHMSLSQKWSIENKKLQKEIAIKNSWQIKIDNTIKILQSFID